MLDRLTENPEKPYAVVLGGSKVSDKLGVIGHLLPRVDAMLIGGGMLFEAGGGAIRSSIELMPGLGPQDFTPKTAPGLLRSVAQSTLPALLVFVLPLLAMGLVAGFSQVGFKIAPEAVAAKFSKLDPIKGFSKVFGTRAVVRFGLAVGKLGALVACLGVVGALQMYHLGVLGDMELGPALKVALSTVMAPVAAALSAILLLSVLDLIYQRHQFAKDQRMSKKELKEDLKQSEGDPQLKGRIRQLQREMAGRRMMADVPQATVTVTNPTHVAVSLLYDPDSGSSAPRVLAKGLDEVAQKIKAVSRESNVPLYEDVPLARALHAQVEIGDEIPEDLFEAVAVVIGYVLGADASKASRRQAEVAR